MKKLIIALAALIMPAMVMADGWDEAMYRQIESRIVAPVFRDKAYASGMKTANTAAKNQKALQKAIDKCSKDGGGRVVVSCGKNGKKAIYQVGAIELKSGVNLVIEENAEIQFAFEPDLYPTVYTRYEGLDVYNYSPCIYSNGTKNIGITGKGTINGYGSRDTFWQWVGEERWGFKPGVTTENSRMPYAGERLGTRDSLQWMCENRVPVEKRVFGKGRGLRMQLVNLVNSENILIEGVTMLNSPFWVMHPMFSKNITVRDVYVFNEGPNGDGCDPESCEDVLIENCRFHTGDDCIAIKSGRNADGFLNPRPSKNIIVRGCKMEDGHGGVVIGSEISGGCENVFAENCQMDSPKLDRVLRLKTNTCRGGETKNIYMRNITVGQCKEAVMRININYQPKEKAERGHIPYVHNVWMENVTCQKSKYGVELNGITEADAIYDIHVRNCEFNGVQAEPYFKENRVKDVYFENLKVNGKTILSEIPYKSYAEWMAMSEIQRNPDSRLLDFGDKPKWGYVVGIELEALLDAYLHCGNEKILDYVKSYPERMIDAEGNVTGYKYEDFNLDNCRPAHFLYRFNELYPSEGATKALKTVFRQLENQPRTDEGVYWHKAIYHDQVWLDGIFMGLPFKTIAAPSMVAAGKKGQKQLKAIYDDIVHQITMTDARTYDAATGLWKHAWDSKHGMFWANPETGQSKHTWARAMGWFAMAQLEILDAMPEGTAGREEIVKMLNKTMAAAIRYQDEATGTWYDVMDVKDNRNYLESTATAMFAYVLLKGARMGYLDNSFRGAGMKAYKGIINNFIEVNPDRTISLTRCCAVSGLGPEKNPRRDGSFEYYISEPIRENDGKGIGPFIWATLEMESMGFDTSSRY